MFHAVSGGSAILRPKGTPEALTDIHNDENNKPCPVFPRNSPTCFCKKQQLSENIALLMMCMWDRGQHRLRQRMVCHSPNPLYHCISKTLEMQFQHHDSKKILLSTVPITVGFFSPLDFRAKSIIFPSFPNLFSFNVELNAQEESQCQHL